MNSNLFLQEGEEIILGKFGDNAVGKWAGFSDLAGQISNLRAARRV
jgi:hypothetical protein